MMNPPSRAAKARSLLCEKEGQAILGEKIDFTSVEPGNPFDYKDADNIPDKVIRSGVDNTKGK